MAFLCTLCISSLLSIWILTTLKKKKTIQFLDPENCIIPAPCLTSHYFHHYTKSMARIRGPASLKKEFLKKWIMGLQICTPWKKNIMSRKNSIKLAADVAMASAGDASTCWSRTVLADAFTRGHHGRALVRHVLGRHKARRILNKCRRLPRKIGPVRKKIEALKRLVPGGELMEDKSSLIQETLDYIVSLTAQVDIMRLLADAAEFKNPHQV